MLKKLRVALAVIFWLGITLLFLDFTGALHGWLGWMAKVQFLPAVLALNVAVIIGLVVLTLVFGRVYCSVICPLGVFQDGVARIHVNALRCRKKRLPYSYSPEMKWLRYGVWTLFVIALIAGVQALVALLAPYSAWGRIVQNLFQPVYIWVNNLFAALAERAGSYAFYEKEVWLRSLPTFIVAIVTLIVVVVLAWKGGRTYCNTLCPVGTTLSFFSRFAMFRPVIDTEKCRNCKQCEHACKASCIDIANHRIDYSRCVDCFNCIDTCKFGALHYRYAWGKGNGSSKVSSRSSERPAEAGSDRTYRPGAAGDSRGRSPLRRTPKTGSALSMNAIMDEKEEKPQEEEAVAVEETLPDSAAIQGAWKALVGKFSDRPRLANALSQAKLREEEGEGVKSVYFSVSNAAQKQWIEEKMLRDLERQFRELLSCHKVNLHVDDIPEENTGERVPYMPEEKAKVLMDTNPEVRELVAALGLDTK